MRSSTLRSAFVAGIAALVLFSAPLESKACEWLWPWNWCRRPTATYAAPVCSPCVPCTPCAPQTCYYVPQTSYRTTYRYVPVTTCCPVNTCDPCTGCAVTAYRPYTSAVLRPALLPYRSYRIVYAQPYAPSCAPCGVSCAPCGTSCSPCGTSCGPCASYAPSCASGTCGLSAPSSLPLSTGSGCSSCTAPPVSSGPLTPSPANTVPSLPSGPSASLSPSASAPRTFASPSTTAPGASGNSGASSGSSASPASPATGTSTYLRPWMPNSYTGPSSRPIASGTIPLPKMEPSIKPIPQPSASPASVSPPQLMPPNNDSTKGVFRQAVYVTTPAAPVAQSQPAVDPYDWHAARD